MPLVVNIYHLLRFVIEPAVTDKPVNSAHIQIGGVLC
jgi:hypothetical protein